MRTLIESKLIDIGDGKFQPVANFKVDIFNVADKAYVEIWIYAETTSRVGDNGHSWIPVRQMFMKPGEMMFKRLSAEIERLAV